VGLPFAQPSLVRCGGGPTARRHFLFSRRRRAGRPLRTDLMAVQDGAARISSELPSSVPRLGGLAQVLAPKWPHNCGTYGVARAARIRDSTALGLRSMVRMGPV
jgi:hypothetical protein